MYSWVVRLFRRGRGPIGERVELRPPDRADYDLYARWYGDEEIWHLTSWAARPMTASSVKRLFENRERSESSVSFAIHPRGKDAPVGVVSLTNISKANASADMSIIVGDPGERARGYGADAINTILGHAFDDLGLHRVGLSVFEFNEPAIATYEKLGFREEGRLRGAIERGGSFHDAILMSILAPEWRKRAKNS